MADKTIKSDFNYASERASALKNGSASLQRTVAVSKDHQSTISGNAQAATYIMKVHSTASEIASAIYSISGQIQTVAANFEAVDQQASTNLFRSPLPSPGVRNNG